jgi:hypothetical protein
MAERFEQEYSDIKENNVPVSRFLQLVIAAILAVFVWHAASYWNSDPLSADATAPAARTRPAAPSP